MEVILIQDASIQAPAASISISVGSNNDPKKLQGLAHFLEHLVFMGSEKYPEQNGIMDYIKHNGGYVNAYTDRIETNFYF